MDWPYNEYYREDYGCFKASNGCIQCMTESSTKRDKYGHFIKRDNYPACESWLTRIIEEKKKGNIGGHVSYLMESL